MGECIICKKNDDGSEEHIIPFAIGGNEKFYSICGICNSLLGEKVDDLLIHDDLIRTMIGHFEIKGRKKAVLDLATTPTGWKTTDNKKAIIKKSGDDKNSYRWLYNTNPKFEVVKNGNNLNMTYSGADLDSIANLGIKELKKLGCTIKKDDLEKILMSNLDVKMSHQTLKHEITYNINNYIPCAYKIAFELAYKKYGTDFLISEKGEFMRTCLYNQLYKGKYCFHKDKVVLSFPSNDFKNRCVSYIKEIENEKYVIIELFNIIRLTVDISF